jgi:hypothetical protein
MERTDEHKARVEVASREINEGIEEFQSERDPRQTIRMICECSNPDCDRVVAIDVAEYEAVREEPRHFVVVRDHVEADVERVVRDFGSYVVVAKREGAPARIAEEQDPRS